MLKENDNIVDSNIVGEAWPTVFPGGDDPTLYGHVDFEPKGSFEDRILVGAMLFLAAVRMLMISKAADVTRQPDLIVIVLVGAILGFSAGLTGIGGGVFLSPILLIFGWCTIRQSTAVAAGFILLNSIGGLAGYIASDQSWPMGAGWLVIAAFVGCLFGGELASHRASSLTLQKLLAAVLAIAAVKMVYTAL